MGNKLETGYAEERKARKSGRLKKTQGPRGNEKEMTVLMSR